MPHLLLLVAVLLVAASCASPPTSPTIPAEAATPTPESAESSRPVTPVSPAKTYVAVKSPSPPPSASAPLVPVPSDSITRLAYHPDPDHMWNRLFRQLFGRTDGDGQEFGLDSLDPLL